MGIYQCESSILQTNATPNKKSITDDVFPAAGGLAGGKAGSQLFVMGLDALGGYVFARMAHNMG